MKTTPHNSTLHYELPGKPEERRNALIKHIAKEMEKGKTQRQIAAEISGLNQVQVSEIAQESIHRRRVLSEAMEGHRYANLNDEVVQQAGFNPKQRLYFDVETDEEEGKIILNISKDRVEIEDDEVKQ